MASASCAASGFLPKLGGLSIRVTGVLIFLKEVGSLVDEISAGSWPDWIGAIGTSLAFLVAAGSYMQSVRLRRESQARLVYSKIVQTQYFGTGAEFGLLPNKASIGNEAAGVQFVQPSQFNEAHYRALMPVIQMTVVIHNGSKELIGPVKVQIVNLGRKQLYEDTSIIFSPIEPDSEKRVSFVIPNEDYPGEPSLGSTVLFRDASGRWWRRHHVEPIEAVHDDPENSSPTPVERAAYAQMAKAMRMAPSPDLALSVRVRWHRMIRKLRRKRPIP